MQKYIHWINTNVPWVKNRYFITCFIFLVYVSFFDKNSIIYQSQQKAQLNELKKSIDFYKEEIEITRKSLHDLSTNINTMEGYAREKYLMKKDDEDVFIVTRETKK
jgi:cell division protein FtsB